MINMEENLRWNDNIGQEVHEGDLVFALHGKYTIEKVKRLSKKRNIDYEPTVVFEDGRTMYSFYVLSLTALGISSLDHIQDAGLPGFDAIGNRLHVGDIVLSVEPFQCRESKGEILKLSPKTCKVSRIPDSYHPNESHVRKYSEVLSLSAIRKTDIEIPDE